MKNRYEYKKPGIVKLLVNKYSESKPIEVISDKNMIVINNGTSPFSQELYSFIVDNELTLLDITFASEGRLIFDFYEMEKIILTDYYICFYYDIKGKITERKYFYSSIQSLFGERHVEYERFRF